MFTQPKDPNNKNKPAFKKFCSYCHRTNHSISACFKKQRDDEDKRDAYARSKSQKSFVQYFRSPSNARIKHYDNRYRSRSTSRNNSYNNNYSPFYNKNRSTVYTTRTAVLHLEIDLAMTKVIDTTLALDINHAPIRETTI